MINTYDTLHLSTLDEDSHKKTCGYWYLVRERTLAHTAFRTRAGLLRWLDERGLALSQPLPDHGTFSYQDINGAYRNEMHLDSAELVAWDRLLDSPSVVLVTRKLDNGEYTDARITLDADGLRTVHYLNPNVYGRRVFNYAESVALMDGGPP